MYVADGSGSSMLQSLRNKFWGPNQVAPDVENQSEAPEQPPEPNEGVREESSENEPGGHSGSGQEESGSGTSEEWSSNEEDPDKDISPSEDVTDVEHGNSSPSGYSESIASHVTPSKFGKEFEEEKFLQHPFCICHVTILSASEITTFWAIMVNLIFIMILVILGYIVGGHPAEYDIYETLALIITVIVTAISVTLYIAIKDSFKLTLLEKIALTWYISVCFQVLILIIMTIGEFVNYSQVPETPDLSYRSPLKSRHSDPQDVECARRLMEGILPWFWILLDLYFLVVMGPFLGWVRLRVCSQLKIAKAQKERRWSSKKKEDQSKASSTKEAEPPKVKSLQRRDTPTPSQFEEEVHEGLLSGSDIVQPEQGDELDGKFPKEPPDVINIDGEGGSDDSAISGSDQTTGNDVQK